MPFLPPPFVSFMYLCPYILHVSLSVHGLGISGRFRICDTLKGQCHEIFDFRFFHESVSPQPLSILLGSSNVFTNLRRYSQIKVHHRCVQMFSQLCGDMPRSRCTTGVVDTRGKFTAGVVDTTVENLPSVSMTPALPVANLPPISANI